MDPGVPKTKLNGPLSCLAVWVGGALVVFAVLGLGLGVHAFAEPRYLGKTAREWFRPWGPDRRGQERLTQAAPEALPMLLSGVRYRELPAERWLSDRLAQLPNWAARFRFQLGEPSRIPYAALDSIVASATQQNFAEALMRDFDTLSIDEQVYILKAAQRDSCPERVAATLRPLLLRLMDRDPRAVTDALRRARGQGSHQVAGHREFARARAAALVLLRQPVAARPAAASLFALAREGAERALIEGAGERELAEFLIRLGDLGAQRAESVGWMRETPEFRWRQLHAHWQLAWCRLVPDSRAAEAYLASAELGLPLSERAEAVGQLLAITGVRSNPPADFGDWMRRLLGLPLRTPDSPEGGIRSSTIVEILDRLEFEAPMSPSWGNSLWAGLGSSSPEVRAKSAELLWKLEVRTPEAVESAARFLQRGMEPEAMIRVFLQAGVLPAEVHALVRQLAQGQIPAKWNMHEVRNTGAGQGNGPVEAQVSNSGEPLPLVRAAQELLRRTATGSVAP